MENGRRATAADALLGEGVEAVEVGRTVAGVEGGAGAEGIVEAVGHGQRARR